MDGLAAHSPLGASSAERWLNCPGSVTLIKKLELPETDEPDYRRDGTAAHEAAARCLTDGMDGWEVIGQTFNEVEVGEEIANAIQVYLDNVRPLMKEGEYGVEHRFHHPELHPDFFGTADFWRCHEGLLHVVDYKHGEGIAVDVKDNPQLLYYAYAVMQRHPDVRLVTLRIVQPRGHHPDGPVRSSVVDASDVAEWAEKTLLPAMHAINERGDLLPGEHCRFCPAKLVCPVLTGLFGAAMKADPKDVLTMSDEELGRNYQYRDAVKSYIKALEDMTYNRLSQGHAVPGTKLVASRANRIWKAGAPEIVKARFGDQAFTAPEMKSPAQIEKLGPTAAAVVSEWAFTPQTGLTVVLEKDKRPAVKVQTAKEAFGASLAALQEAAE